MKLILIFAAVAFVFFWLGFGLFALLSVGKEADRASNEAYEKPRGE